MPERSSHQHSARSEAEPAPEHDEAPPHRTLLQRWHHARVATRATRLIMKEDLRLLADKARGQHGTRPMAPLAEEQAAADELYRLDHPNGRSAYAAPGTPPRLARPVLMIPGLTMDAASFDPMSQHLAANNGAWAVWVAADRQFHLGGAGGPVANPTQLQKVRLFQLQYVDPNAAPSAKASQIEQALAAIQRVTGAGTVDVVTHSAGGTDFRLYLDREADKGPAAHGPAVGEAVLIGPASHGTAMGNVGAAVGDAMDVDEAGAELAVGSPLIAMLNRDWGRQRGQIRGHVTIIAIGGAPTYGPGGISDGDGYMPVRDAPMPDADTVVLHGLDETAVAHLREVEYFGVIAAVDDALRRGASVVGH